MYIKLLLYYWGRSIYVYVTGIQNILNINQLDIKQRRTYVKLSNTKNWNDAHFIQFYKWTKRA